MLYLPVVFEYKEADPIAVFSCPVVLDNNAWYPTAVLAPLVGVFP
jgi:hypothetical protein